MTSHPERLEVTPVDPRIFEWIVSGDEFVDRTCVQCGLGAALFVSAGRFVSLCPSCVARRIESLRTRTGPGEPAWITVLDREACKEAAFQAWKTEGLYHVVFDGLWKCGRCGMLIQPRQAHYHNEPGAAKARRTARRARTRCGARRRQAREDRRGSRPPGCTRNRRRRRPGPSALR